ncbi:gluconate:H+ symporter [Anaerosinus massiliensis]|uniref:gluconate:H+ symporter n=1 Tax=Massilibacillus massiliensis TaxID=1806837 RepID=UPI000A3FC867|nr:gluconate:H+ symporter [Massilibacillus massiliensis]
MPLIILALGIVLLFYMIVGLKLNSFIALIIASGIVGVSEGLPLLQIFDSIEKGVGGTLGHLAIVISFGAMLGKLMADSGGAQRIATTLIDNFGRKNVKWAICLTGFIVGIALFYEVGFVLMIPLVFTIAASAKIPLLEVGIPMTAAISCTHGFLPPHPGATAIAIMYNADIGLTLMYGILVAIPTVICAGPLLVNFYKDLKVEIPAGLYNPKVFTEEEMPSFSVSLLTALSPVFLMAFASVTKMVMAKDDPINVFFNFVGHPDMALFIALLLAMYTFGFSRGKTMTEIMKTCESSIVSIAMIMLIIGGGGAFKQVLLDSGVGNYIADLMLGLNMSPLVLTFIIATVIRIAVGSATVTALTTGGIVAPLIPLTGVSPELMVLVTGAGSLIVGPPNDAGFWMFKEFFGLTVKQCIKTWCVMETVIGLVGFASVMVLSMFV